MIVLTHSLLGYVFLSSLWWYGLWVAAIVCIGHGDYEVTLYFPKMEGNLRGLMDELETALPPEGIHQLIKCLLEALALLHRGDKEKGEPPLAFRDVKCKDPCHVTSRIND